MGFQDFPKFFLAERAWAANRRKSSIQGIIFLISQFYIISLQHRQDASHY